MRVLADENIPRAIVTRLRDQGHDILYAAESRARTPDIDLLTEAEAQGYVILTESSPSRILSGRRRVTNSHFETLCRYFKVGPSAFISTDQ